MASMGAGEFLGRYVVDGLVAFHAGQAGVGLYQHRHAAVCGQRLREPQRFGRAKRAIHAHSVGSHGRKRCGGNLGRRAQEGAAVFLEGHGYENGQVGVLFCGKQRGACLGKIGKRFGQDYVAASFNGGVYLLGE